MLKHSDIIEKLDKLQKAAIVASAFADEPFEQAGVPVIRRELLEELGKRAGVSYASASRSWDPALLGRMTQELALEGGKDGARLFITPDLKAAIDPYAEGLSEDGYFNGLIGSAAVRAVHSVGGAVGLSKLSLSAEEVAYLDRQEDASAIHDFVRKPFVQAAEGAGCEVVFSDPVRLNTGYYHTNRALFTDALNGAYGDAFAVGEGEPAAADAVKLLHGKISLGGLEIPLQRALRRYAQLAVYEKEGSVSCHDLEESLRDGSAVDEETLNKAVDEIIDFALRLEESELHLPPMPKPVPQPMPQPVAPVVPEAQPAEGEEGASAAAPAGQETLPDGGQTAPAETASAGSEGAETPAEAEGTEAQEEQETAGGEGEIPAETPAAPEGTEAQEATSVAEEVSAETLAGPAAVQADAGIAEEAPAAPEQILSADALFAAYAETERELGDAARRKAAESCIVLLKNEAVLPLGRGKRIAVLGEAYRDLSPLAERFTIVGVSAGYDRGEARSDELIPEAVRAANAADVVLVFLYPDIEGQALALPANRIALLGALQRAKKRVIALVCGDRPVDMRFDGAVAASLVVPSDGPYACEALARVLSGEVNPSGRLTRTAYDNADAYFRAYREDRDAGRMHIGSLAGYRRYTTSDEKVRYPFGYGIGYSKFVYSGLRLEKDAVIFTLTNAGLYDGSEVVQIYMGAPKTSRIVPKRQLIDFRKVFLRAGESKEITFYLPPMRYATFDYSAYTENVEAGLYRIYVGSSVQDIRLQGKRYLAGVTREPMSERAADFFPNGDYVTIENVGEEHRISDRERSDKSERLRRIRKVAIYAMPVAALLFFILFTVFILSTALDYALLSATDAETVSWILYVAAIAILGVIPLLGGLNRKRVAVMRTIGLYAFPILFVACFVVGAVLISPNGGEAEEIAMRVLSCLTIAVPIFTIVAVLIERDLWYNKTGEDHWSKYYFERKREARATSEVEFEEAFRIAEETRAAQEAAQSAEVKEKPEQIAAVPQFYDKRLTFEQFIRDGKIFLTERGMEAGDRTLCGYVGALASTQLIIVPAGEGAALAGLMAEYFGKPAYIDNAETYRRHEELYTQWKQGGRASYPTNLYRALCTAGRERAYLHTVIVRHVQPAALEALFLPVADVLSHRRTALPISWGESKILPPNLVIVAEVETDRLDLPQSIAEVAAVLTPECATCEPAEHKTMMQVVGYDRYSAMRQTVRDDYPLPEGCWKNVDLLQALCKSARIGNRLWLKLEYHAAVSVACGAAAEDALDGALASEVMPWLKTAWKDDVCGKELPEALTEVFGEKNVELSLAAIAGEEAE